MAVKLRLSRHGTTNRPFYWLVAADSRFARDGRYLEKLGTYNSLLDTENPERLNLNKERIQHWLSVGAQPSERTIKLLSLIKLEGIDKFTNKKKSTIGKPKTTKNPDKRKSTKPAEKSTTAPEETKPTAEDVKHPQNNHKKQPISQNNQYKNQKTLANKRSPK